MQLDVVRDGGDRPVERVPDQTQRDVDDLVLPLRAERALPQLREDETDLAQVPLLQQVVFQNFGQLVTNRSALPCLFSEVDQAPSGDKALHDVGRLMDSHRQPLQNARVGVDLVHNAVLLSLGLGRHSGQFFLRLVVQ